MAVPVRVGDHLAHVHEAMRATHDRVCRRTLTHRWDRCASTPTLYAAGHALDLLDLDAAPELVASALHARMCRDPECGVADAREHGQRAFGTMARALHGWYREARETVPG